ncbi:hypothetical protein N1851_008576 [Merluccius polli]|uniref:Uncharacterized protein n=1 Tax=Merluccius polli TaxID=89951 RepID=A0AA47P4H1_MERPO|nr:hypothetical protein N1851_008576 [Merluccius polli]
MCNPPPPGSSSSCCSPTTLYIPLSLLVHPQPGLLLLALPRAPEAPGPGIPQVYFQQKERSCSNTRGCRITPSDTVLIWPSGHVIAEVGRAGGKHHLVGPEALALHAHHDVTQATLQTQPVQMRQHGVTEVWDVPMDPGPRRTLALFAQGLLLALIVWELMRMCPTFPHVEGGLPLIYSRDTLMSRYTGTTSPPADLLNLPETFKILLYRRKPREERPTWGGPGQRLHRRGSRPPMPGMILSNGRSLRSKMEELRTNMRVCFVYREAGLLVFTETWLHEHIPNSLIELEGFSLVRADRDETSGKSRGGGICVFVSDSWCRNYSVRETVYSP